MKENTVFPIKADDLAVLWGAEAKLSGNLRPYAQKDETQGERSDLWVEGWTGDADSFTWEVEVREAGEYAVSIKYSCPPKAAGTEYVISSGDSRITDRTEGTSRLMTTDYSVWTSFERKELKERLHLRAGRSTIQLCAAEAPKGAEVMRFYTLDLTPAKARERIASAQERAREKRASTKWFVDAKYGVTFHWTPTTQPRKGPQKAFPEAVRDLDVAAFASTVEETGAGYVIFTSTHAPHWFPAPIEAIEKTLPGNTCDRDLIGDLADALNKKGIKLILYYPGGRGSEDDAPDIPWGKASGWTEDKNVYFDNFCRIFTEIGRRYGSKVAGYWFDFCPFNAPHHFEPLYDAAKTGNPDRIIAWNSWINRVPSDFQEYLAGEIADNIIDIDPGEFAHLQPHVWIVLDDEDWVHEQPDTVIGAPHMSTSELVSFVNACVKKNIVVSMNVSIYQDGSISPATLDQLKAVRSAVRTEEQK